MSHLIDILMIHYDNQAQANEAVHSLLYTGINGVAKIHIVNNGAPGIFDHWRQNAHVEVHDTGSNLGWEGGLKYGLERTKAPYVMFLNDDTHWPLASFGWARKMLSHFKDPKVAAIGPASNFVSGIQNSFMRSAVHVSVPFLIGFCMLVDRKKLEEVGGVDDTLPGGDDFDISMRFRAAGYTLLADKTVYVHHHGQQTGRRVHANYWDSEDHQDKVNNALIDKHGLRAFWETRGGYQPEKYWEWSNVQDSEGQAVQALVKGDKVVELGCGPTKTVEEAVGLDLYAKGEKIPTLEGLESVADIQCDVSGPLPFDDGSVDCIVARHILEHCIDPIATLKNWVKVLKPSGRIIFALPDQEITNTVPMNVEHVHAFTRDNLKSFAGAAGLKESEFIDPKNGVSFITAYVKVETPDVVEALRGDMVADTEQEVQREHSLRGEG